MTAILLITFLVLMLLNVPIAFCMLLSSLLTLLVADINPIMMTLETTRSLSNFYSFLAVPFFILAGEIMSVGGLSSRLIDVVKAFLGHKRNGLPFVSVISSQLFGAVSGASAATCAAIGSMMVPALEKNKYPRPFATALVACAGTTGALIPPSIPLLLYGTIANVSIEKLFIAGVIPGILVGGGIMLMASHLARKFDITKENKANWKEKLRASSKAIWVLILMLIIFGGIMGGIFTATEASAVAVVYALLVSLFIYKEIKLKDLPKVFLNACKTTAALSFLLACASLFAWVLSIGKMPEVISSSMVAAGEGIVNFFGKNFTPEQFFFWRKIVILLLLNVALFVISMFIDVAPGLLIVVPVLLPIAQTLGMGSGLEAVHFGLIVVSNMVIGLVTPPVGSTLFVASGVGKVSINSMIPYVLRFILVMMIVQLLITFVPFITTALPSLMS